MSNRKLFKIAGLVGIITIASKVIGLIRDLTIANAYGTSITADAYNFAYLLTGNALILLGGLGGPFHSATIAILSKIKHDPKDAGSFLIKILFYTFLVFTAITILVIFFKSQIVRFIAPAIGQDEEYKKTLWQLIESQLLIMSPLIIISGLLGILCGVGNMFGGYFFPSISPIFPSLSIVFFILFFNDFKGGIALGIGTLIGSILQLLFQLPDLSNAIKNKNIEIINLPNKKYLNDFLFFLGPALLSTTIGQITVYIDSFFCSGFEEGSWTATVFANRLIQLPLGVLLTSFLVPFFPRFSELVNENKIDALKESSMTVIKMLWFLTFPIAAYLLVFSHDFISLLFERGEFNIRSTQLTSEILIALLLSMIAYVARDTLTRVFYSLGNSKLPLLVAVCSILLKIILNYVLAGKYHAVGIAFSTSIITVFNFLLLWFLLRKKIGSLGFQSNWIQIKKMFIATFIMLIFTFIFSILCKGLIKIIPILFIGKLFYLGINFVLSFGIYLFLSRYLKINEAQKLLSEASIIFKRF